MPERSVIQAGRWRVVLVDSITQLEPGDAGSIAVSGSHGGTSAAAYAAEVPLVLAVFNDAGVGKDEAGVIGLARLEAQGRAAATVSHLSARIGEAADAWENGVLSRVNAGAARLGLRVGQRLKEALTGLRTPT
ncbi:MAG TPA: hypothetical protein VJL84_01830 [Kiloniellales bacterium]|nr:hypothetical protein [Kiloniellales bacterium]